MLLSKKQFGHEYRHAHAHAIARACAIGRALMRSIILGTLSSTSSLVELFCLQSQIYFQRPLTEGERDLMKRSTLIKTAAAL